MPQLPVGLFVSGDTAGPRGLIRRRFSCLGSRCSQTSVVFVSAPRPCLCWARSRNARAAPLKRLKKKKKTPTDGTFQSRQHLTAWAAASHVNLIKILFTETLETNLPVCCLLSLCRSFIKTPAPNLRTEQREGIS